MGANVSFGEELAAPEALWAGERTLAGVDAGLCREHKRVLADVLGQIERAVLAYLSSSNRCRSGFSVGWTTEKSGRQAGPLTGWPVKRLQALDDAGRLTEAAQLGRFGKRVLRPRQ